ncbi:MAG: hypothetical protein K6E54_00530 [Bacteroidaceae bacterium]|nr:hypothetical protein [Bacteroidaceae bacterium]
MKKILSTIMLALVTISASAQFDEGKKYLGANLNGFNLSYSEATDLSINLGANAGYVVQDNLLLIGTLNFDFCNSELNKFELGGKIRYYFDDNGFFVSGGAKFVHEYIGDFNDFQITPEIGYCFMLNKNLALQPSIYYDMSFSDFTEKSRLGLAVGLGWFF